MHGTIRFSVDDHALFHEGIAMMINCQPGTVMVAEASNGREAMVVGKIAQRITGRGDDLAQIVFSQSR